MTKVEKIKALKANYFEDMTLGQICLELEKLGYKLK